MEAEKSLIILDGPAHEGVVASDGVGRLHGGREGVQRGEVGRVVREAAEEAAGLSRICPSVCASIALSGVEGEPGGRRRMGGRRDRRGGALAADPAARNGSARVNGLDRRLDGGAGRAPRDLLG